MSPAVRFPLLLAASVAVLVVFYRGRGSSSASADSEALPDGTSYLPLYQDLWAQPTMAELRRELMGYGLLYTIVDPFLLNSAEADQEISFADDGTCVFASANSSCRGASWRLRQRHAHKIVKFAATRRLIKMAMAAG